MSTMCRSLFRSRVLYMTTVTVGIVPLWLACTPTSTRNDKTELSGIETIRLEVGHRTRWRELRIEGTTDLPDGAVVTYQVTHAAASEFAPSEWPAQNLIDDGTAVVHAGEYWARLNTTYWPEGTVDVIVQFPVSPQPEAIRLQYGDFGEQLTGANVTTFGASKVVTVEHTFNWTR